MDPDKQLELTVSEDTVTEELARRLEEESQRLDPDLVELFHEVLNGGKERVTLDETRGLLLYTPTFAEVLRNGLDWLREQSNNGPWQKLQRTRLGAARSKLEAHRTDVEVDSRVSAIQAALGLDEGEACYFLAASDYSYLAEYPLDGEYTFSEGLAEIVPGFDKGSFDAQYKKFLESSGPGTSGGDWALSSIRKAARDIVSQHLDSELFPGGKHTLHHKISQSNLKRVALALEGAGPAAARFCSVLEDIGTEFLNGAASKKRILLNMPFNIEIGPPPELRKDDPGSRFDGSSGSPRTERLRRLDALLPEIARYWDEAATLLEQAAEEHRKMLKSLGGSGSMTNPRTEQWEKDGRKFVRKD